MQRDIEVADLDLVLALVRGRTLSDASKRIGVDPSTVFRAVRRLETKLGEKLFERGRQGYAPSELALELARSAERIEAEMATARALTANAQSEPAGLLRITTTDSILQCLLLPLLGGFAERYPHIELELIAANEIANLSRRDADIAIRATRKPPEHLIGKNFGALRYALYGTAAHANVTASPWIAPDDSLPEHPSVAWRKKHYPKILPRYRCNSLVAVAAAIAAGVGVGAIPLYLAHGNSALVALSEPIQDIDSQLWLLFHPDIKQLQRVHALVDYLTAHLQLP